MSYNNKEIFKNLVLLLIVGVCLLSFLKLSEEVWTVESVVYLDQKVAYWVYSMRTPLLNNIMKVITSLADVTTIIILVLFLFTIFITKKRKKYIIPLVVTVLGNSLFVEIVKITFARPRPLINNALVSENSYSFPSGHALIAITFYGLLVLYLCKVLKSNILKLVSLLIWVGLVLSIGFSRVYLGVHWPSDILASYLIGISWLSFILLCIENRKGFKIIGRVY